MKLFPAFLLGVLMSLHIPDKKIDNRTKISITLYSASLYVFIAAFFTLQNKH